MDPRTFNGLTAAAPWGIIAAMLIRSILAACLVAGAAGAVDINVAEDEAKKAEAVILTPLEGEGYYDSAALAELALARERRSPTGALWRSFAVPGWGQIYNGKYVKSGCIMAAEAGTLYMAIDNYITARRYLREAREAEDEAVREAKYAKHQDYIVETEFWGWLFVGTLAYSMMDAYVDAHLSDWEVSDLPADEEASSRLDIDVEIRGPYLTLAIWF
ncbi:MAG: DUF5683 domain-containing protein [Candidatus Zixiibacteriota bacterium]|jgi:hypothetical protein